MTNTEYLERAIALSHEHGCADVFDAGLLPTHYQPIVGTDSVSVRVLSHGTELYQHTSPQDISVAEMLDLRPEELTEHDLQQNMFGLIAYTSGQLMQARKRHPGQRMFWFQLPVLCAEKDLVEVISSGVISISLVRGQDRGSLRMRYGCGYLSRDESMLPWAPAT